MLYYRFRFICRAQINHIKTATVKANPFKLIKKTLFHATANFVVFFLFLFRFPLLFASHLNMVHGDENTMQLLCCNFKTNRFTFSVALALVICLALLLQVFCYIDFIKSTRHVRDCGCRCLCVCLGVWMCDTNHTHNLEVCHRFRHLDRVQKCY